MYGNGSTAFQLGAITGGILGEGTVQAAMFFGTGGIGSLAESTALRGARSSEMESFTAQSAMRAESLAAREAVAAAPANVIRADFSAGLGAQGVLPYRAGVNYSFNTFNENLGGSLGPVSTAKIPLSNGQLVQEIATRAEAWGGRRGLSAAGGGPVQGTLKHDYAARLLDLYQIMYGSRGLETEVSFLKGGSVNYGTAESVRLDVFEAATGSAWDYKFTLNPTLSPSRVRRIINNAPVGNITPIGP